MTKVAVKSISQVDINVWSQTIMQEQIYNPGHSILELYNILVQVRFATSRTKLDIQYNIVYELPHELPSALRLRILGNQQILEKYTIWIKTEPSAQSHSQQFNFSNSSQKILKIPLLYSTQGVIYLIHAQNSMKILCKY